jgi:hypothetical protein
MRLHQLPFAVLACLISHTAISDPPVANDELFFDGFDDIPPNIAFVTSTTMQPGTLGSLVAADSLCQSRAANSALPGGYRAYLSSSTSNALARLGTARGWRRVDGLPITNVAADFAAGRFIYPLRLNELGADLGDTIATTASSSTGAYNGLGDCGNYSLGSGLVSSGTTAGQGSLFNSSYVQSCSSPSRLYCLGVDNQGSFLRITPPGSVRLVFVTAAGWQPGGGIHGADAMCQSEANGAGLSGTFLALLPTSSASAASRFDANGALWTRVDGAHLSATATATLSATFWDTAPGLSADGSQYFGSLPVWGGASSLTSSGTAPSTCSNWTSSVGNGTGGLAGQSSVQMLLASTSYACSSTIAHLICFQQ